MNLSNLKCLAAPLALFLALSLSACDKHASDAEHTHAEAEHGEHAHGEEDHEHEQDEHHEDEHADHVEITPEAAEASGIGVAIAGPGLIDETLSLTGRITLQPSARAEIHAPYPGPVRAVLRDIGDSVRRGEALARVESAESLQTYSIVTPIAGLVLDRQTNIGDVTSDGALFVIGDLTRLQAELNVASRDIGRVAPGQRVIVSGLHGETRIDAEISSVLPAADARNQTLIARAPLTIAVNSPWRPGMAVRVALVLGEQEAPIAAPREAVQTLEGRDVVFVRVSESEYEARPVSLGRGGREQVEILSGLNAGETYVAENAFLLKAELGKGSASHEH